MTASSARRLGSAPAKAAVFGSGGWGLRRAASTACIPQSQWESSVTDLWSCPRAGPALLSSAPLLPPHIRDGEDRGIKLVDKSAYDFAISPVPVPRRLWARAGAIPKDRTKFRTGWSKHAHGTSRRMSILGECPEWQRGRTVNPLADAFVGSSPTSPTILRSQRGVGWQASRIVRRRMAFVGLAKKGGRHRCKGEIAYGPRREAAGVAQW